MNSLFTKKGTEINPKEMLKADSYESRIKKQYKSSKVVWIWQIQGLFHDVEFISGTNEPDYKTIERQLRYTIVAKAKWLEQKYRSARFSYHDFEAQLWKSTYDAIEYYELASDMETEFTLLETLELFWQYRMIDFIRSCLYTQKHSPWYKAASLADDFNEFWPDGSLTWKNG